MDCNNAQPLIATLVLGALENPEAAELHEHLSGCPACRRLYDRDLQTSAGLIGGIPIVDPPAGLKNLVMSRIDALDSPGEQAVRSPAGAGGFRGGWSIRRLRPMTTAAAALAALTIALTGWAAYQTVQVNDLREENDTLERSVRTQWEALTVAASPNVEAVSFKGADASPQTRGALLVDKKQAEAVLMVMDLTPPDSQEVYQLWVWEKGSANPFPAGTFRTWGPGYGMWWFRPPEIPAGSMQFGVTREPRGGSIQPTSPLLFTADMPEGEDRAP